MCSGIYSGKLKVLSVLLWANLSRQGTTRDKIMKNGTTDICCVNRNDLKSPSDYQSLVVRILLIVSICIDTIRLSGYYTSNLLFNMVLWNWRCLTTGTIPCLFLKIAVLVLLYCYRSIITDRYIVAIRPDLVLVDLVVRRAVIINITIILCEGRKRKI